MDGKMMVNTHQHDGLMLKIYNVKSVTASCVIFL